MTFGVDSTRDDAVTESTPGEHPPLMSRREARLHAEKLKRDEIARTLEAERLAEEYRLRAEHASRVEAERRQRLDDEARFQAQINTSQSLPVLDPLMVAPQPAPVAPEPLPVAALVGEPTTELATVTAPDSEVNSSEKPDWESVPIRGKRKPSSARDKQQRSARKKTQPRTSGTAKRRVARSFVVTVVGCLLFVIALPATGFNQSLADLAGKRTKHQSVVVGANAEQVSTVALSSYTVTSYTDALKLQYGNMDFAYVVEDKGPIRWPFPAAVPISSGFGARVAPCWSCSSYHEGLDFNPEIGTPFFAVADGTVTEVHDDLWGLGKWVVIHHDVDGLQFDSLYGHMLRDSTAVEVGDQVKAGDHIGNVGNTGTSTGPHLHFEIILDGTPVDPFAWLKEHTAGNH